MKLGVTNIVSLLLSFVKTILMTARHDYKIKTFDKTKEKINTIEHLIVKLEKKIGECRNEIECLRQQILFSRVLNLILSILIIALILFLR